VREHRETVINALSHKPVAFVPRGELFIRSDFLDRYFGGVSGGFIGQLEAAASGLGLSLVGIDLSGESSRSFLSRKAYQPLKDYFLTGATNGPVSRLIEAYGFRDAMLSLRKKPDLFREMAARFLKEARDTVRMAVNNGFSAMAMADDIAGNNGLLFSSGHFAELILPVYRDYAAIVREQGLFPFIHSDGDMKAVIHLIAGAGYDCLHPVDAQARMDLAELLETFGKHISFMGHIDLLAWSVAHISDEVHRAEEEFKHGGLILGTTGSIPADIPEEKLRAFYPLWEG